MSATALAEKLARPTLRCIECGNVQDLYRERKFRCVCGGLFEVVHNHENLSLLRQFLESQFQRRAAGFIESPPGRSGVWRFYELIMPEMRSDEMITLGEGIVPIVRAGPHISRWVGGDLDLWLILEGQGPTGSFKDFGGAVMMSVAKKAGVSAVACASTGDTSAMTAAYSAVANFPCVVLLPQGKYTAVQLTQAVAYGARVIDIPGTFDDCMRVMSDLVEHHGVYPANSLNPSRIEGHQATVFLIAQAFNWILPEWFAVPVGNGSNSSSIGKGMRLLLEHGFVQKGARILGCQSEAANPLAASWQKIRDIPNEQKLSCWRNVYRRRIDLGETVATAARIGDPVSREKVMREIVASNGAVTQADEGSIVHATQLSARDGIMVCPQTGIALAGLREAVARNVVKKGERVVVVSTATGLKFPEAYGVNANAIEKAADVSTKTVAKMLGL
ncbi:MAG TPA: threonine synthase [Candidatus Paceibacterota bacterium]|nr:threonine synthase [Candidatus Paceibacterota bacterium]